MSGPAFPRPQGLYVHLPFCMAKCHYCDFAVALWRRGRPEAYVETVLAEAHAIRTSGPRFGGGRPRARETGPPGPFASVYYGGGTPTTTPIETFARLHRGLTSLFPVAEGAEITAEANPETVDGAYLARLRGIGVNRLSIGMQSADAAELAVLGRGHTREDVARSVAAARQAGFDNLSLDLMFGLPGQTMETWRASLDVALELGPEHISAYGLQVEERTPFHHWVRSGTIAVPGDDVQAEMYEELRSRLARAGYVHYEISNFALPGRESRHNLLYWDNGEYLGLGVGAHSHWNGWRWGNTGNLRAYREAVAAGRAPLDPEASYAVSARQALGDAMMLGLRRLDGVDLDDLASRYGTDPRSLWRDDLADLEGRGLLAITGRHARLTERGFLLGNLVFERFVSA